MPSQEEKGSDFISIVIADSTRIHTQLLAEAMHSDHGLQVVASASNSGDLLAAITRVPVDVVVLSYNLDDQHGRGTEVLREIRAVRPQIKGVLLLDTSRPDDVLDCFRAGAKGIFSKNERLESLAKCIHCVHDGQIWARSVDLEHALDALASSPLVRTTNHKGLELLSVRERQVVQNLAAGMTNKEIADSLGLSRHTIKNYLFRIFDKLGVSSRTELLYLTMSSQSAPDNGGSPSTNDFAEVLKAAEAGQAWAQLRLAEHYADSGHTDANPVLAFKWCLLAENSAADLSRRVQIRKTELKQTVSEQKIAEAERRAAEWLHGNTKATKSPASEANASKSRPKTAGAPF